MRRGRPPGGLDGPQFYGQKSVARRIPALTGGWNAKDPLASMARDQAVVLDNFVPTTGGIDLRPGYTTSVTGFPAPVDSLMEYSGTIQNTLFAAAGNGIYNVSAPGAVGAALVTGLGSARFQHCMFSTPGGQFLVVCNGVDPVQYYDGSSWATPAITPTLGSVSSSNFTNIAPFAQRLFFVEGNSLRVWYLPVASIAGTASLLDLGAFCRLGGKLVAQATWTRDGGTGADDVAVFVTSKGEVLLYQGTDPSSAATWSLVGVFRIPEPVGQRCMLQSGADVGIITTQGVLSLSTVLPMSLSREQKSAVTDNIKGAFQAAYQAYGNIFGWQVIEYPRGALCIVNVPYTDGMTFDQYVMNSLTGAWCRFVNINARCWSLFKDKLYFAKAGRVCQFDTGYKDDDNPIVGSALPAFSNFGMVGNKQFLMARPLYIAPQGTVPTLTCKVDYDTSPPAVESQSAPPVETFWGAPWGSLWGPPTVSVSEWQSIEGDGNVGSVYIAESAKTKLTLQHIDVLMHPGGLL